MGLESMKRSPWKVVKMTGETFRKVASFETEKEARVWAKSHGFPAIRRYGRGSRGEVIWIND